MQFLDQSGFNRAVSFHFTCIMVMVMMVMVIIHVTSPALSVILSPFH